MATREELERWTEATRRTQRRLAIGVALGAVVALALSLWRRDVGGFALLAVALFALSGYWITSSHLADWQRQREELDHPKPRHAGRYER
jgi:hypothetical protein